MDTLRKPKILDVAVFDVVATLAAAVAVAPRRDVVTISCSFIILMCVAIIIHIALGIPTRLNAYLGINTVEEVHDSRRKKQHTTS
jgi:hypothetical protein